MLIPAELYSVSEHFARRQRCIWYYNKMTRQRYFAFDARHIIASGMFR